jgi:hypothetical protein
MPALIVPPKKKVVAIIKGGLGNQLFQFAAARRLAFKNGAELVLDDRTGFERDYTYRRSFELGNFAHGCMIASMSDRLEPLGRLRRRFRKWLNRIKPQNLRRYVEESSPEFDPQVLSLSWDGSLTLDGYWQSELYFKDCEGEIRNNLVPSSPNPYEEIGVLRRIMEEESVSVHLRYFDSKPAAISRNVQPEYLNLALSMMRKSIPNAQFFIFSDNLERARHALHSEKNVTFVRYMHPAITSRSEFQLMAACRHHIIANSTFSWWSAWLSSHPAKTVIAPGQKIRGPDGTLVWGFRGLLPKEWYVI